MITALQEKILKRLIDNLPLSASRGIDLSDLDDLSLVCGAVKELHNLGYVLSVCTLCSAGAIIKDKGRSYFREKIKEQYGVAIMSEIELIEKDIEQASKFTISNDQKTADLEVKRLSSIYKDIAEGLSIYPRQTRVKNIYDRNSDGGIKQPDQINNLKIIIERLEHRKVDILRKAEEQRIKSGGIRIENNPVFNNTITVNISISSVFDAIEKSPLMDDEKDILRGKLADIDAAIQGKKDKKTIWEKIKSTFGWIASKAIDVGLAVTLVPYLAEILKGLGV